MKNIFLLTLTFFTFSCSSGGVVQQACDHAASLGGSDAEPDCAETIREMCPTQAESVSECILNSETETKALPCMLACALESSTLGSADASEPPTVETPEAPEAPEARELSRDELREVNAAEHGGDITIEVQEARLIQSRGTELPAFRIRLTNDSELTLTYLKVTATWISSEGNPIGESDHPVLLVSDYSTDSPMRPGFVLSYPERANRYSTNEGLPADLWEGGTVQFEVTSLEFEEVETP